MKKAIFIIVLIASLLVIRNLVVSIYTLWQKQHLIGKVQEELKREKEKNSELKAKIKEAESPTFLEEQARNKLFLVKEGEQDILISKKLLEPQEVLASQTQVLPYWKQWINLFFK